jgi:DNA repair protein RecO (recombination protein O)
MKTITEIIVLHHTKFREDSIVLHTLSREYGRRSFLIRTGRKAGMALFLPLNVLETEVTENPKSDLWFASRPVSVLPLNGIRNNPYKNTMTLFMSEVLYRTVKDGALENGLYEWCRKSISTLDALENDFSNFHIRFLLELAVALGFRPDVDDIAPFAGAHLPVLERFIKASFSESMLIPLNGESRNEIADCLIRYLEFHTESAINIRSLSVLRELYGEGS